MWAYKSAYANKWLDDYYWFSKPVKPYTVDQCIEIAKNVNQKANMVKNAKRVITR